VTAERAAPRASSGADAPASRVAALEVENLSFAYGARPALQGLSFRVMPGEFAVLLGPNGAGKSTLFALVTRLFDAPGEAAIRIFGTALRRDPRQGLARLGVVFQQPTLDPELSVRENLLYHAALHGLSRAEAASRAARELDRIGLADRARDRVRNLSGGQRRRARSPAPCSPPPPAAAGRADGRLDAASRASCSTMRRLCRDEASRFSGRRT
jgi:ABC-2 type transport system ATP-binding protein